MGLRAEEKSVCVRERNGELGREEHKENFQVNDKLDESSVKEYAMNYTCP